MLPTCQEGIPKSVLCLGPNPASLAARVQTRKRKYHNRTIHGAMREAEAYLTKRLRERDLGRGKEGVRLTLNEYLDRWLNTAPQPSGDALWSGMSCTA